MPAPSLNRATLIYYAFMLLAASAAAQQPTPLRPIQIDSGKLLGFLTPDQKVVAYKGIPYAQPPVDELRWRPPQPVGKWKKVLFARDFGPHCLQSGGYPDMVFHDSGASEDCLTLNVWAPFNPKPDRKLPALPVMVWIYGGGFPPEAPRESPGRPIPRPSRRHRRLHELPPRHLRLLRPSRTRPPNPPTTPPATTALWTRPPPSPGSAATSQPSAAIPPTSLSSASLPAPGPSARSWPRPSPTGLFAKAIGQSGAEFPGRRSQHASRDQAEQANTDWASRAFGSSKLFSLRLLPAKEILAAAMSAPSPHFGPIIDGYFLPDTLPHIFADGKQAHIPLLAGWVANERPPPTLRPPPTASPSRPTSSSAPTPSSSSPSTPPPPTPKPSAPPTTSPAITLHGLPHLVLARSPDQNRQRPRLPLLLRPSLTRRSQPLHRHGAFHSDDIEYVFGTLDSRPGMAIRPEDRALSELMQQYWTNFARTGNPDPANSTLPKWPVYNAADNYQVMHLDATPAAQPDTRRPRYLFLDSVWSRPGAP